MARKKSEIILEPCSIRIPPKIKKEIERQATENSRSFNSQMLLILTNAVRVPGTPKSNSEQNGQTALPLFSSN